MVVFLIKSESGWISGEKHDFMFLFGHANESVVDNSRLGIVYHKNTHAHTYTQLLLFHEIQGMTLFKE